MKLIPQLKLKAIIVASLAMTGAPVFVPAASEIRSLGPLGSDTMSFGFGAAGPGVAVGTSGDVYSYTSGGHQAFHTRSFGALVNMHSRLTDSNTYPDAVITVNGGLPDTSVAIGASYSSTGPAWIDAVGYAWSGSTCAPFWF